MNIDEFREKLKNGLKLEKTNSIKICRHISLIGFRNE